MKQAKLARKVAAVGLARYMARKRAGDKPEHNGLFPLPSPGSVNQVKLKDGNPGKDPAVIDVEFEHDGVKYSANLITGDRITVNYHMYPSEELRKMMPPDGLRKIERKVGRVVDGTGFENQRVNSSVGSNPTPSAIAGRAVRDDFICLWTHGGSTAELSLMNEYKEVLKREYDVEIEPPVFFFNRIKAKVEGRGEGTLLMQKVIKILDEKGVTVVNHVDPYGSMDLAPLIQFYEKYGFELVADRLMVRRPK